MRDALVDRNEEIEQTCHGVEKRPVIQIGPTHLVNGANFVTRQLPGQTLWDAAIQEHPHDGREDRLGGDSLGEQG